MHQSLFKNSTSTQNVKFIKKIKINHRLPEEKKLYVKPVVVAYRSRPMFSAGRRPLVREFREAPFTFPDRSFLLLVFFFFGVGNWRRLFFSNCSRFFFFLGRRRIVIFSQKIIDAPALIDFDFELQFASNSVARHLVMPVIIARHE